MLPSSLVTADWLSQQLDQPGLRLFDATKYLPDEGKDGLNEFYASHIPSARFFDIDLFADPETELPHMLPSAGRFARLIGSAGIAVGDAVVFYDQKGQASAARGWWLMRLFGHDNTALLDGGLPRWRALGHPLASGLPSPAAPAIFTPTLHTEHMRGLGDMLANLDSDANLVLDARPAARFTGRAPEPRMGVAPGHIPGSRNLPATELLDPHQCFLPIDVLRQRFAGVGVDGSRPVVTTCGTGVTAAMLAFAMHLAGLPAAAVYDGSWTEWGGRADTPKAVGD